MTRERFPLDWFLPAFLAAAIVVVTLSSTAHAESSVYPDPDEVLIGDRFVFEMAVGEEKSDVTATRLPPWTVRDSWGQTVYVAPLRVTYGTDASEDTWLTDLWTGQPVGAMRTRPVVASEPSLITSSSREEWSTIIAYSSDATARHCLNALTETHNAAPCHLVFDEFWLPDSQGVAKWDGDGNAPTSIVSGGVQWMLKEFHRGSSQYGSAPGYGPVRQLAISEEVPWGVVDDNVEHDFRLSDAYHRVARGDGSEEYRAWRDAQHSAFPVFGDLDVTHRLGGIDETWRLVIQGDDSFLTLTATMNWYDSEEPNVFNFGFGVSRPTLTTTPGRWGDSTKPQPGPGGWPRLDDAVAHVWNRSFAARAPPVTGWGFTATCQEKCPREGSFVTMWFSLQDLRAAQKAAPDESFAGARMLLRPTGETVQFEFTASQRFEPETATDLTVGAPQIPDREPAELAAGVGIAGGAVLGLRLLWKRAATIVGFAMGKTKRPESETRKRVGDLIAAEPGIHFREIVRRMDISNGTAVYHLETLLRRGKVRAEQRGGYRCFFAADPGPQDVTAILALKAAGARRIVDALREGPKEIALLSGSTGLRHSTVAYHVGKMVDAGLLEMRIEGRARQFTLTELARRLVS